MDSEDRFGDYTLGLHACVPDVFSLIGDTRRFEYRSFKHGIQTLADKAERESPHQSKVCEWIHHPIIRVHEFSPMCPSGCSWLWVTPHFNPRNLVSHDLFSCRHLTLALSCRCLILSVHLVADERVPSLSACQHLYTRIPSDFASMHRLEA